MQSTCIYTLVQDLNRNNSELILHASTQTQCLYPYLSYQFNYTASGPQAATHSYPNPMYTPELYQAETLYNDVYVAPQEQVYENYNAGAGVLLLLLQMNKCMRTVNLCNTGVLCVRLN